MNEYKRLFDYGNMTLEIGGVEEKQKNEEDFVSYISFRPKCSCMDFREFKATLFYDLIMGRVNFEPVPTDDDSSELYRICDEDNAYFRISEDDGIGKLMIYSRNKSMDLSYNLKNCAYLLRTIFSGFVIDEDMMTEDLRSFTDPSSRSIDDLFTGTRRKDLASFSRKPSRKFVLTEFGIYPNPEMEDNADYLSANFRTKVEFSYSDLFHLRNGLQAEFFARKESDMDDPYDPCFVFSDLELKFMFDGCSGSDVKRDMFRSFLERASIAYAVENKAVRTDYLLKPLEMSVSFETSYTGCASSYPNSDTSGSMGQIITFGSRNKNMTLKENADDFLVSVFMLSEYLSDLGIPAESLRTLLGGLEIDDNPTMNFARYTVWDIPRY